MSAALICSPEHSWGLGPLLWTMLSCWLAGLSGSHSCCEPMESMDEVALSGPEDTGLLCCPHLKLTVFLPELWKEGNLLMILKMCIIQLSYEGLFSE